MPGSKRMQCMFFISFPSPQDSPVEQRPVRETGGSGNAKNSKNDDVPELIRHAGRARHKPVRMSFSL
jgi:hypothetical protein